MGPAAIPIAIGLSAASAGYGVFAGERARSQAAKQYAQSRSDAANQRAQEQQQMAQDKIDMQTLADKQRTEQDATNASLRAQQDASLADIRGKIPGMTDQLGADLLTQQEHAYTRMAPQLENRLNALGLLQSGALPEAQAKYQGDLESQRQAALASFRQNADTTLNIQQPLANSSADIGRQSEALGRNLATSQNNLSQQFTNQNNAMVNETARQQYLAGLASANNAAAQSSANAYMNFGGQLASGAMQYYGNQSKAPAPAPDPALEALKKQRGR